MRSMRPGVPLVTRLGAVAAATVLATLPTIGPAAAGETQSWTNKDVLPATPGYAATSVTVSFPSKRAVDIKGWVEDRCDADGYGAYVYAYRTAPSPDGGSRYRVFGTYKDVNGCGNGRIHFDPGPYRTPTKASKVYGLEVHLCEMDADAAQPTYTRCKVKYFDNWRL